MGKYLNLALVDALLQVLEAGSVTRAAERMHVTPSAVTQQLRRLDEATGFEVLRRGVTPPQLTSRGQGFLTHAREALESSRRALDAGREVELRLGFLNGYPRTGREPFLEDFAHRMPGVRLKLQQLEWGRQAGAVLSGEVDAGLLRPPLADITGLELITVLREPRVVAVSASSPLAQQGSLLLEDIEGLPVLGALNADQDWTRYWVLAPRPSGLPVSYGSWAATMEEAVSTVAMSETIMITAESVGIRYSHPGVVYLPLDDAPYCTVALATRADDRREPINALRRAAEGALATGPADEAPQRADG
ncbi:LysR family transcriptional regulator [Galactobacter valiniphilus]|uniref:LysR substrate-binding domain-containing protein n=1 Tax=Galactobacter valiniphilus TaxID=2676122 RepID=UPI0037360701